VQIRVVCLVPTTGLESTASGVCFSPSFRRDCATPGASRCRRGLIASGVISRKPKPVPPTKDDDSDIGDNDNSDDNDDNDNSDENDKCDDSDDNDNSNLSPSPTHQRLYAVRT